MEVERLIEPAKDWTGETWGQRVDAAASFLYLHGYITTAQRRQVSQKLDRQYRDGVAAGRIIERPKSLPTSDSGAGR